MKMLRSGALFLCSISFCLTVLFLLSAKVLAEHNPLEGLSGPPFADPSEVQEMSEDWKKQKISYDDTVGNVDIAVTLDQHLYPALLPMIKKYAKDNGLKINVKEGTCGISSGMLESKSVDIGGFCCPPGKTDRLPGIKFHTVGIDALALLVHPDNPVDNVTIEQARQLFMGEIYSWSEVRAAQGGKGHDIPVQPVGRLHCQLKPGHWRLLLDGEDLFSTSMIEVGAIPDMIAKVASDPGAIGYEILWNLIRHNDQGKVKAINIDGYSPNKAEHLISGRYPLYRVYSITTWEEKHTVNPEAKKLVEYIFAHVKDIKKEHQIIPASSLRKAGWKFKGAELVGEPDKR